MATMHNPAPMKDWLKDYLDDLTIPSIIDREFLTMVGSGALRAKIAHIEIHDMKLPAKKQRKLPERLSFSELAAILMQIFQFRIIKTSQQSKDTLLGLYVPPNKGVWDRIQHGANAEGIYTTDVEFFHHLTSIIETDARPKDIDDVLNRIRKFAPLVNITTDTHLFPVKNGIYNQKTKELEPFSPERVYLTKINVNYEPTATNIQIPEPDGTLWDVDTWLSDLSVTPEVNELLWQVIAASLQPNRGMNKSIWFYSESGNNGKGTVGQLIKNLLGAGNYSSLAVADFKHEFIKEGLIGVAANIADENDVDQFIDSVRDYKASVTGDDIVVNRKHKDPIRLQFRGLNIQMMNGLPKTRDKTGSFYRRLIIVPFIKSFTNNGEKSFIKTDYINRQAVLEYVLHKALSLEFDEFIIPQASAHLLEQYREKNNPVLDFWKELKGEFAWDLLPRQFLYDLYQKWFERGNPSGTMIAQRTFFDNLSPIIDADGDWKNHISSDATNIRTGKLMEADEPLISEYGLDRPYKNGTPSPWAHPTFNGNNPQKKRDFVRKTKYRGVLRN